MTGILTKAHKGVDMNLLAFRAPDRVYHSDSGPAGLGGYSNQGHAWRFQIPANLQCWGTDNLLEYLAAIITPWIDLLNGRLKSGDCTLSMIDSTTAEGWMQKSNFEKSGKDPIQVSVCADAARHHAKLFMDANIKGYSQWFAGKLNNVTNTLSWDWHSNKKELTSILCLHFPQQMPMHFKISPLPSKISSWLILLLQRLPANKQLREEHTTTNLALERWEEYCLSVGCRDIFMDSLSKQEQILMLGAFAMAVRSGWFSDKKIGTLVERTVRGTISNVVQTFWSSGQQNPTKDADNELSILLSWQFRAFRNVNPKEEQQKALPFSVLDKLAKRQATKTDKGITQLTIGTAFFACRPLNTPKSRKAKKNAQNCYDSKNICFFKSGHQLPLQSNNLELADSMATTFKMQKNDEKFDTVTHGRADDSVLCPVLQWARLVSRIWTYPGVSLDTNVCTVCKNGRMEHITKKTILQHLRAACATIRSACLGFEPHEIETHSLRLGAAMEMYLGEIPVYTIMLIGR